MNPKQENTVRPRFIFLAAPLLLGACANSILSDDRIKSNTATALGVSADRVTITDRRYDGMTNTYYTASAGGRSYACVLNGGTALSLGMTNPPQCTPK